MAGKKDPELYKLWEFEDAALTELGRRQAGELGKHIDENWASIRPGLMVVSPLLRAIETAEHAGMLARAAQEGIRVECSEHCRESCVNSARGPGRGGRGEGRGTDRGRGASQVRAQPVRQAESGEGAAEAVPGDQVRISRGGRGPLVQGGTSECMEQPPRREGRRTD